jgi:hypothetical protein
LAGLGQTEFLDEGLNVAETFYRWGMDTLENFFEVFRPGGEGSREADVIVPIQNQAVAQLDQVTQALVRSPSVTGLQNLYRQVEKIGRDFAAFISDERFEDGRASEQAANTVMPYIDGTCGYSWPPPMRATQRNCLRWGDGTPGGVGTDGMLGAISRAILRQGGTLPPPLLTQGYGAGYAVLAPGGSQSYPWIPQSGTIPNISPLPSIRPSPVPVVSAGMGDMLLPVVLLGGAAFMLFQKRRS